MSASDRPTFMLFALWRLMAAGLVMLYHFCEYGPPAFAEFSTDLELLSQLLDLFFIISGFLIWTHYSGRLHSVAEFKAFIVRRLARLYPLHLLTLSCFCLVWLLVAVGLINANMVDYFTFIELLKELLLVNAWGLTDILNFNYVSWSLSAEWFCYLLFPLILLVSRKAGLLGLVSLLVISVFVLEGLTYFDLMPFPTWLEANTWGAYRVFADFTLGAVIADLAAKRLLTVRSHWIAWSTFAAAIGVMLADLSWGYWSMFAIAFALYIAAQVEINAPEKSSYLKSLMPLASVSFRIYLWHPVVGNALLGLLWARWLEPTNAMSFMTVLLIAMFISVITALISARFFEAPMRRAILTWAEKRAIRKTVGKQTRASVPAE